MTPEPASPGQRPLDAKLASLDALRRWAATDRASLVAAAWRTGNRNISELSTAAGVDRKTIYADLHSHNIDPARDREEPPMLTATATTADGFAELPVPGWRHQHLLSVRRRVERGYGTHYETRVKPFTGREAEPELPEEWRGMHPSDDENWELSSQRHNEIDLVRSAWAPERFKVQVGALLAGGTTTGYRPPAESWATYQTARDALRAAYAALDSTPDTMWRAALLRVVDAKQPAEVAAANWDYIAAQFAALDSWLLRVLGESEYPFQALRGAAATHGVDITGWLIASTYDYESSWGTGTAAQEIADLIESGDARIKAVQEMTRTETTGR